MVRKTSSVIKEAVNLQLDYAMLKLNGLQTLEDLYFEYAVETNRTHIPTGPVYNPYLWNLNEAGLNDSMDYGAIMEGMEKHAKYSYEAGLFSPFKTVTDKNAPFGKNAFLPVDPGGNPAARGKGPFGVFGSWTSNVADMYGTRNLNLTRRDQLRNDVNVGGVSMNRFANQTTANVAGAYPNQAFKYGYKAEHAPNNEPGNASARFLDPEVNPDKQGYQSSRRFQSYVAQNNNIINNDPSGTD